MNRDGPEEQRREAERVASTNGNGEPAPVENAKSTAGMLKELYEPGVLSKEEYLSKLEAVLGL